MRGALLALLVAAPAHAEEARAFVETLAPESVYAGEELRLRLRVGFDAEYFREHAVPIFLQPMDVPLRVEAEWLAGVAGARRLADPPAPDGPRLRVAVNDGVVALPRAADVVRDGRSFAVLEIERRFAALSPGVLSIPAPSLRFAAGGRARDDFFGERASNARPVVVAGEPRAVRVLALPEAGRPAGFSGAVGRFRVLASADRARVAPGEVVRLTLRIEGEGAPELLAPPSLEDLSGFHLFGTSEVEGARGSRMFRYDLAPVAPVTEIPPIAFWYFDPTPPPGYRVARTDPLPLEVASPPRARRAVWPYWIAGSTLFAALAAGALFRRARAPQAAAKARAELAAAAVRAKKDQPSRLEAFVEFVAKGLSCPPGSVVDPRLAERLRAAGVDAALASRAAGAVDRLVAERYGGAPAAIDDLPELVEALERAFERQRP